MDTAAANLKQAAGAVDGFVASATRGRAPGE